MCIYIYILNYIYIRPGRVLSNLGLSGILPKFGDGVGGAACGTSCFCSSIGTLPGTCCGRPLPCLVVLHLRKKFTLGLCVMDCTDIALGLITLAFLVYIVSCGIMALEWHLRKIANYGNNRGTCGCLLFH